MWPGFDPQYLPQFISMKIPIKKYVMDESLSWEERYLKLEAHHKEETEWLIAYIEKHIHPTVANVVKASD